MSIKYDSPTKTFYLEGRDITYAFFINKFGYAEHLYYGKKIHRDYLLVSRGQGAHSFTAKIPGVSEKGLAFYDGMMPEISFYGTGDYREPTVLPLFDDGSIITQLHYAGHEILSEKPPIPGMPSLDGTETLALYLYDDIRDFGATLYYTVYPDLNVVARRIVYKNNSDKPVSLRRAFSFALALPSGEYEALSLWGSWARERHPERVSLHHGVYSIDSKRGSSSTALNPFIAIMEKGATETSGEVWGFNLVYSSSYKLMAERAVNGDVVVSGGINDIGFSSKLDPGAEFPTPEVVMTYSASGLGEMSRDFHNAYREHLIPKRFVKAHRPLLINNWEATYFKFTYEKLAAIIDGVAGTGIDTFVLDDGWFGKRNDEYRGLGDWVPNEEKLGGSLQRLVDHAHSKGMKFGIWFEPEMVNEDSDIFRAHPDWAIGLPDRKRCLSRYQYVMDITRSEVRDYIVDSVNKVIRDYGIEYVKWDCNRNLTEFYSLGRDADRQGDLAHRYALGLYDLCERIVNANPDVFFEGCSGGGGRFDPAMLYYFPQIWTSDDSDAEERTKIQYATSYCYPPSAMSCHVSAVPNHQTARITSMKTRADIAHLGATGYELDTTVFTEDDVATVKSQVSDYLKLEDLILSGDLYRIEDPFSSNYFSEAFVAPDKSRAHLVCYRSKSDPNPESHRVKMAGLDPNKEYFSPELGIILHGSTLMSVGIFVTFPKGDYQTKTYSFEEK